MHFCFGLNKLKRIIQYIFMQRFFLCIQLEPNDPFLNKNEYCCIFKVLKKYFIVLTNKKVHGIIIIIPFPVETSCWLMHRKFMQFGVQF